MRIPKRIKVGRKWYKVEQVRHAQVFGTMGRVCYDTNIIHVATHSNRTNMRFKQEAQYDTFWHELTHAILKDMGSKLEKNERFVTAFANRLTKAILSARF